MYLSRNKAIRLKGFLEKEFCLQKREGFSVGFEMLQVQQGLYELDLCIKFSKDCVYGKKNLIDGIEKQVFPVAKEYAEQNLWVENGSNILSLRVTNAAGIGIASTSASATKLFEIPR